MTKFRVSSIEKDKGTSKGDTAKLKLVCEDRPTIYESHIYLYVPWSEVDNYPIDAEFVLLPAEAKVALFGSEAPSEIRTATGSRMLTHHETLVDRVLRITEENL